MFQAVEHIVADGAVEHVGIGAGIANALADHRLVQLSVIVLPNRDASLRRLKQPGKEMRQVVSTAAASDDGDSAAGRRVEGNAVERLHAVLV